MSFFTDNSGKETHPFGKGGGKITADSLKTEVIGEIGLDQEIREGGDHGIPLVVVIPKQKHKSVQLNRGEVEHINAQFLISLCMVCFLRKRLYFFFSTGSV